MASDREENLEIREDASVTCKENDETENSSKLIEVRQKGLDTLKVYCRKRKHDVLLEYILHCESTDGAKVEVHQECRRNFTDPKRLKMTENIDSSSGKRLRSSIGSSFSRKTHCLFCGKEAILDTCHVNRNDIHQVRTIELRYKIIYQSEVRNDQWGVEVCGRLQNCNDLVADEAIYHRQCHTKFFHKMGASTKSVG